MIGPDRRRQDRDRAAPRRAGRRAVRQGRGDQIYRGRLRRPRRRIDGARPGRSGDSYGDRRAPRRSRRARREGRRRTIDRRAQPGDGLTATNAPGNPFAATLGSIFGNAAPQPQPQPPPGPPGDIARVRDQVRGEIERGFYDVRLIEIEVEETPSMPIGMLGMEQGGADLGEMLGGLIPKRKTRKRVTVSEARRIFTQEEAAKLIDMDAVKREALRRAGEDGIIFIDEIDKVAGREGARGGPDVSREGVQRDILPIVEGSTVTTKHGNGQDRSRALYRRRRVSHQQTVGSHSRTPGPLSDSRRARLAHRRRLQNDSHPAQECADRTISRAAGDRRAWS